MERRMRVVVAAAVVVAVVAMCGRAVEGQMAGDEVFCLDRDNQQCSIGMPMNCVTRNCELPVPYFFDMTLTGIFRPGFSCLLQDATCVNPDCAVEPCIIANQQTDWVIGFLTRDAMGNFLATNCNTICDAFNAPVTGTCNAGPISDLRNNPIQAVIATYFTPLVCAPGGGNTAAPGINVRRRERSRQFAAVAQTAQSLLMTQTKAVSRAPARAQMLRYAALWRRRLCSSLPEPRGNRMATQSEPRATEQVRDAERQIHEEYQEVDIEKLYPDVPELKDEEMLFGVTARRIRLLQLISMTLVAASFVMTYEAPSGHKEHAFSKPQRFLRLQWDRFWYDPRVDGPYRPGEQPEPITTEGGQAEAAASSTGGPK
ncbi:hypothetical protein FVE85_3712 [Porphyridium purpureum]|uniref:Uncharacterized protein n=1 Tax=Porphyridium purpureum TaxID=35688 RepID=A0A5J4YNM1_PORPP|nr:hypothetical protein FVE85_3712 [Porphyridium purpureum]|eukprot:POR7529..scf249_10